MQKNFRQKRLEEVDADIDVEVNNRNYRWMMAIKYDNFLLI